MKRWCENCKDYKKSWADANPRDPMLWNNTRCWSCDKHESTFATNQDREVAKKVEENTYLRNVKEVVRFVAYWNPNCAVVTNYDGCYYWVSLLIYEPSQRSMEEVWRVFPPNGIDQRKWGGSYDRKGHKWLSDSRKEVEWIVMTLGGETNYDNLLMVFPNYKLKLSFREEYSLEKAGIIISNLPYSALNNPDSYVKPLDIVKVKKRSWGTNYNHVGVYLGNEKVCHVWDPNGKSNNRVRIDSWETFLKDRTDYPVRHHSIIPFKYWEKMVEQIAKSVVERYREGNYDVLGNNCEHFANMIVYGLDFSQQGGHFVKGYASSTILINEARYLHYNIFSIASRMSELEEKCDIEFDLRNENHRNDQKLDSLASYENPEVRDKIREIKGYNESQWKAMIEVPPKSDCQIM